MKIGTDAMVFGALIDGSYKAKALDVGTGTGVLSLMVAQRFPQLHIRAIEIEPGAALEASANFRKSPFADRLEVIHGDFIQMAHAPFDLIFTNPPYFERSHKSASQERNLARHDESLPLGKLFSKVSSLLSPNGSFWIILPHQTMDQYMPEAASCGLFPEKEVLIFGKKGQPVRKIIVFSKQRGMLTQSTFTVRNADSTYTDEYKDLTSEYHFNVLK